MGVVSANRTHGFSSIISATRAGASFLAGHWPGPRHRVVTTGGKTENSGRCAASPAIRRAASRNAQSPGRHSANKSARSGTTSATTATRGADKTQSAAARKPASHRLRSRPRRFRCARTPDWPASAAPSIGLRDPCPMPSTLSRAARCRCSGRRGLFDEPLHHAGQRFIASLCAGLYSRSSRQNNQVQTRQATIVAPPGQAIPLAQWRRRRLRATALPSLRGTTNAARGAFDGSAKRRCQRNCSSG